MNISTLVKARRLRSDMDIIADAVADAMGMRITYVQSMNQSLFPRLVDIILDEDEEDENALSDLRFLAENGNKLPVDLKTTSYEDIRSYVLEHAEDIIGEVRVDIYGDYEDACGRKFRRARTLRSQKNSQDYAREYTTPGS